MSDPLHSAMAARLRRQRVMKMKMFCPRPATLSPYILFPLPTIFASSPLENESGDELLFHVAMGFAPCGDCRRNRRRISAPTPVQPPGGSPLNGDGGGGCPPPPCAAGTAGGPELPLAASCSI
ncbi:hypothetical protein NL676_030325 [Syzygium grande]|nr:hypothetical protein NL676_030325 [Syzygium grande]